MQNSNVRYSDLYKGQVVYLDKGFTCADNGYREVKQDSNGFFFDCEAGKHHLIGQRDDNGLLVGVYYFDTNVK